MGFTLKVSGPDAVNLGINNITSVAFGMETPNDANARSTDLGSTLTITGKILTAMNGNAADDTINLAKWSKVPAEQAIAYRKVEVEVETAGQVVRKYELTDAFVVDYQEDFGSDVGVGTFKLVVRQKKDKTDDVKIEGGWAV